MNNEKSTHIRTQKILIRKNHEAFRGASVCTQIVGQEWTSYFAALRAYKKMPSSFKAKPKKPGYAHKAATVHTGRNGFKFVDGTLYFATDQNAVSVFAKMERVCRRHRCA